MADQDLEVKVDETGALTVGVVEKEVLTSAQRNLSNDSYPAENEDDFCFEGSTVYEDKNSFISKLIEKIRVNPCLYDHKSPLWRNLDVKRETWEKIGRELQVESVPYLEKEFKKLKDNYRKCMKRRKSEKKIGKGTPMCNFFRELTFLRDHMSNFDGIFTPTEDELETANSTPSFVVVREPINVDSPTKLLNHVHKLKGEIPILPKTDIPIISKNDVQFLPKSDISTSLPVVPIPSVTVNPIQSVVPLVGPPDSKRQKLIANETDPQNRQQQYVSLRIDNAKDTHQLFCDSLVEPLRSLSSKKSKLAKSKIMQVLYDLEDD